ncbi:MAG: tRNA (adenosine(37)-N6)-threonylcarbamoyltransferase complex transferase subunit TsaD [bacterium]
MRILAIETSCDETGVAIVEGTKTPEGFRFALLGAAALNSQAALHAEYGGVFPNLAKREHEKNLPIMLEQALTQSSKETPLSVRNHLSELGIDAIAVTQGPGLEPALWTGIEFAQKLAKEKNLPLLLTNHMEGHLLSSLVQSGKLENVTLPVLALLISGGHTEFDVMREWFHYEVIGQTLDDAVGEAYDKVARMLGLPYPGGPEISKLADISRASQKLLPKRSSDLPRPSSDELRARPFSPEIFVSLPRPMLHTKNCDFSFSGLKTAVLYAIRDIKATSSRAKESPLTPEEKKAFAREFEDAVGDVFVAKTRRALEETGARSFVIGGGVAANRYLRERLYTLIQDEFPDVTFYLPELSITGDNAVMIAEAALARALSGINDAPKENEEVRAYSNRFSILAPK